MATGVHHVYFYPTSWLKKEKKGKKSKGWNEKWGTQVYWLKILNTQWRDAGGGWGCVRDRMT